MTMTRREMIIGTGTAIAGAACTDLGLFKAPAKAAVPQVVVPKVEEIRWAGRLQLHFDVKGGLTMSATNILGATTSPEHLASVNGCFQNHIFDTCDSHTKRVPSRTVLTFRRCDRPDYFDLFTDIDRDADEPVAMNAEVKVFTFVGMSLDRLQQSLHLAVESWVPQYLPVKGAVNKLVL